MRTATGVHTLSIWMHHRTWARAMPRRVRPPSNLLDVPEVVSDSLAAYYARRAHEYDRVYSIPERQEDIGRLKASLRSLFVGRRVLEVAAGTGYWTHEFASAAESVLATDINPEPLAIAKRRSYEKENVAFQIADAFTLDGVTGEFDAAFVGFWWSHVPKRRVPEFAESVTRRLLPGALVVVMDNRVEGTRHPVTGQDSEGNTYQTRALTDGSTWSVMKNFPTESELREAVRPFGRDVAFERLTYYWTMRFTRR